MRQIRISNKKIPLSSIEAFALIQDKSLLKGSWYVDAGRMDVEFEEKYRNAYGRTVTPGSYHAYKSVYIAYQAYRNFIKASNQKILDNRDGFSDEVIKIHSSNVKEDKRSGKGVFLSGAQIRLVE